MLFAIENKSNAYFMSTLVFHRCFHTSIIREDRKHFCKLSTNFDKLQTNRPGNRNLFTCKIENPGFLITIENNYFISILIGNKQKITRWINSEVPWCFA